MNTKDLRAKSLAELNEALAGAHAELRQSKQMHAAGELPNPRVITSTKRTIARIQTVIRELNSKDKKEES